MTEWRWISIELAHAIHDRQLAEHGGADGVRDADAVAAAIARPMQLAHYGTPDVFDLAAAYCWGVARNHGFSDGNKRTAWVLARLFLADHGVRMRFNASDAVLLVESVAAGTTTQDALGAWLRHHAVE
jgi:death-on-curing protein